MRNKEDENAVKTYAADGALIMTVTPSLAHRPMGGGTPQNFFHGFLSVLGTQ